MTAPLNVPLVVNSVIAASAFWPGGTGVLSGVATSWAGATMTLNVLGPDGLTYIATTVTLAANGISAAFTLPAGTIKVVQSGGTATVCYVNAQVIPTNLN
jgi:hypothetical protein